jgi:hypothetical protein
LYAYTRVTPAARQPATASATAAADQPVRLVGWSAVTAQPGQTIDVRVHTDARLWRRWDARRPEPPAVGQPDQQPWPATDGGPGRSGRLGLAADDLPDRLRTSVVE